MSWRRVVISIIFGLISAIFADAYWLSGMFGPESKRLIFGVALSGMVSAAIVFIFYPWVGKRLQDPNLARWKLIASSMLLGALFFFGGTSQWLEKPTYATLLLPRHRLEIKVFGDARTSLQMIWFTTSLGDISFNDVRQHGWQRQEDILNLRDPSENYLEWIGKTGNEVQIVFQSNQPVQIQVLWNGEAANIEVPKGRYVYRKILPVPPYASLFFVWALGLGTISFALLLWIWPEKAKWIENATQWLGSEKPYAHWEIVFLISIGLLAFVLRARNLENTFPSVDEFRHLFGARQMVEEGTIPEYQRSFWTVTVPVMLAFRIFGVHIWSARLMGVIFNVLGLIPFYLVARKFNRSVAIWAAFLYATNPLLIFFARMIREYAYYPFYFSLVAYVMMIFLERFPSKFSFRHHWRYLLHPRLLIPATFLGLSIAYALYDKSSTFKLIFFSFLSLAIVIATKINWQDWVNRALGTIGLTFSILIAFWLYTTNEFFLTFRTTPLRYFFFNPPEQWYFNRAVVLAILAVGAYIYFSFATRSKREFLAFIQANFLIYLAFFTFTDSFSRPFRLRHMMITEIWFVLMIALGSLLLWRFVVLTNDSLHFRVLAMVIFL